jgi:superfamily II DNA/RNA helicase
MTFEQFGLSPALTTALTKLNFTSPTPVQVQAIPTVLTGKDTYINAETGSGKTLAYLLPVYQLLQLEKSATQLLIIVPTHELALQIQRVACDLAQHGGMVVRNVLLIGGTSSERQIEKLKKKPQIVIGTPGRVVDMIERGKLKVDQLKTLVIDEADRLLAGDSLEMLQKIIRACPKQRQMVFVSATEQPQSSEFIEQVAPSVVRLHSADLIVNPNIDHFYIVVDQRDKLDTVRKLIHASNTPKAVVFVHRNDTAVDLAARLEHHKIVVADLHSSHDKEIRKQAMQSFSRGTARVLIASDVAARGLDIPGITHVFNLDVPGKGKDYLHRVGRSGRAGAQGVAVSILVQSEVRLVKQFEKDLGIQIREVILRGGDMFEVAD